MIDLGRSGVFIRQSHLPLNKFSNERASSEKETTMQGATLARLPFHAGCRLSLFFEPSAALPAELIQVFGSLMKKIGILFRDHHDASKRVCGR